MLNQNAARVSPKTVSHRLIGRRALDAGKLKETYAVETDGLGTFEIDVVLSKSVANLKDAGKRADKVTALIAKALADPLAVTALAHDG